jgi:hydrogenase nickel incorporation protein HypA/HybF
MHEMGMCRAVLAAVERRAKGRPVERIGVRVGEALAVDPAVFEQGFQMLAQNGVADGATTEIESTSGETLMLTWLRYRDRATPVAAPAGPSPQEEG